MLEKLAEIVREQTSEAFKFGDSIICAACDFRPCNEPMCNETPHCPDAMSPDGSLMIARWAVLLVAKGLEKMPEAKIEDLKERKRIEGMPTAEYMCAMSNLGINFLNLLSEAIISDRKAKEVKLDV